MTEMIHCDLWRVSIYHPLYPSLRSLPILLPSFSQQRHSFSTHPNPTISHVSSSASCGSLSHTPCRFDCSKVQLRMHLRATRRVTSHHHCLVLLAFPHKLSSIGDVCIPGMTSFDRWGTASGFRPLGPNRFTSEMAYSLSCRDAVLGIAISAGQMVPFPLLFGRSPGRTECSGHRHFRRKRR
jgi:hypothetical protein